MFVLHCPTVYGVLLLLLSCTSENGAQSTSGYPESTPSHGATFENTLSTSASGTTGTQTQLATTDFTANGTAGSLPDAKALDIGMNNTCNCTCLCTRRPAASTQNPSTESPTPWHFSSIFGRFGGHLRTRRSLGVNMNATVSLHDFVRDVSTDNVLTIVMSLFVFLSILLSVAMAVSTGVTRKVFSWIRFVYLILLLVIVVLCSIFYLSFSDSASLVAAGSMLTISLFLLVGYLASKVSLAIRCRSLKVLFAGNSGLLFIRDRKPRGCIATTTTAVPEVINVIMTKTAEVTSFAYNGTAIVTREYDTAFPFLNLTTVFGSQRFKLATSNVVTSGEKTMTSTILTYSRFNYTIVPTVVPGSALKRLDETVSSPLLSDDYSSAYA